MSEKNPEDMTPIEAKSALGGGCRAMEPGWIVASFHDPSRRRGLWFREKRLNHHDLGCNASEPLSDYLGCCESYGRIVGIEICAGREGDDVYANLTDGMVLDSKTLTMIEDALGRASASVCEAGIVDEDGKIIAWKEEESDDGASAEDTLDYLNTLTKDRQTKIVDLLLSSKPAVLSISFTERGGLFILGCEGESFDTKNTVGGFAAHFPAGIALRLTLLLMLAPERQAEILAKLQNLQNIQDETTQTNE
jgi:hypothetical protein